MEKAVVRRGIGAVVLALVAALLLGYLLKGKAPERKEVVNMELPKSPIQIFPEGGETGTGSNTGTADAGKAGVVAAVGAGAVGAGAVGAGAVAAGSSAVDGTKKAGAAVADSGKKLVGTTTGGKAATGKELPVDSKTGNPALTKSNVVVDGSGQAIYGAKTAGVKNTPANFEFRSPGKKEVRPSIDGRLTAKKNSTGSKSGSKAKAPAKSNARLVGEKKLAPVGSRSNKSSKSRKVASSRNKTAKKNTKVASAKKKVVKKKVVKKKVVKKTVAKTNKAAPTGRNKYVVQLLATSNKSKANGLKATMAREGYPAFVSRTTRGGKALYRVRVGSYSGKSSAIKNQASMKRRYRKNAYVQSSIVVRN